MKVEPAAILKALRYARSLLGRWPTRDEFQGLAQQLHDAGLPSSPTTVRKRLGALSWQECIRLAQASREAGAREDTPSRKG